MDKELPVAPSAIGNYVTYKKVGNYIYTSGHVPFSEKKKYQGKIPSEVSIEDGYEAASLCAELTISTLLANGEIKNLQPVNVLGFVNDDNDFQDHAKVLNGFTDKLAEYFDEK
jgi:enamine deaminase RidA (YjgF/YER057c/UK114 family)